MRGQERNLSGPTRNPAAGPRFFTTEALRDDERVPFMRYTAAELLSGRCEMDRLEGAPAFRVDIQAVEASKVRLHHSRNLGLINRRTSRDLTDSVDDVVLLMGVSGEGFIEQDDRRARLSAGQAVFVDFSRPVESAWPDAEMILLQMPRQVFSGADPRRISATTLDADVKLVHLLQSYARAALRDDRTVALPDIAERHLCELAAQLCRGVSGDSAGPGGAARSAARVTAMLEFIALNASNPCLTMQHVAAAVGLSERSGHLQFERSGLTFTRELQAVRLDRARERLIGGSDRVIDVAYAVGFSDPSHFHRLFRRRFGCTPAELRRCG